MMVDAMVLSAMKLMLLSSKTIFRGCIFETLNFIFKYIHFIDGTTDDGRKAERSTYLGSDLLDSLLLHSACQIFYISSCFLIFNFQLPIEIKGCKCTPFPAPTLLSCLSCVCYTCS